MTFLALTALESHWWEGDVFILGPWCRLQEREGSVVNRIHGEIEDPFAGPDELQGARHCVDNYYEEILCDLSRGLSEVHSVNQSMRYWRIIIGPWLKTYVSVLYDRYMTLRQAIDTIPDFRTLLCDGDEFEAPPDDYSFYYWLCTDEYNHYLYSRILTSLGYKFETRRLLDVKLPMFDPRRSWSRDIVKRLCSGLLGLQRLISPKNRPLIILEDTYLGLGVEWRVRVALGRNCRIEYNPRVYDLRSSCFREKRAQAAAAISNNGEFHRIVKELIIRDIPASFMESFSSLRERAIKIAPPKGSIIATAVGWHNNDLFKHYAAIAADDGSYLVALQHGGTYQVHDYVQHYEHEKAVADRFLSWGSGTWDSEKVRPFVSSKLSSVKVLSRVRLGKGILFVGTAEPRYSVFLQVRPQEYVRYLDAQKRFLMALPKWLMSNITARTYPVDFGWGLQARWRNLAPSSRPDVVGRSLQVSMLASSLVVIDALTTTWLEALILNVPLIIFLNRPDTRLLPEVDEALIEMLEVGIVHFSPEDAARFVEKVHCDVDSWWSGTRVQAVRKTVCDRFARTSSNPVEAFASEFKRLLNRSVHSSDLSC